MDMQSLCLSSLIGNLRFFLTSKSINALETTTFITVKYSLISEAVLDKNLIVAQPSKR